MGFGFGRGVARGFAARIDFPKRAEVFGMTEVMP